LISKSSFNKYKSSSTKSSRNNSKGCGFDLPQNIPITKGLLLKFFTGPKIGQNGKFELLNKGRPSILKLISNLFLKFSGICDKIDFKTFFRPK